MDFEKECRAAQPIYQRTNGMAVYVERINCYICTY